MVSTWLAGLLLVGSILEGTEEVAVVGGCDGCAVECVPGWDRLCRESLLHPCVVTCTELHAHPHQQHCGNAIKGLQHFRELLGGHDTELKDDLEGLEGVMLLLH